MKTKCYSVRLQSLVKISDKAYKATAFDGGEEIIPASQIFGTDYEVQKTDAWWITAWILERKTLQYSKKKEAYFDSETRKKLPTFEIEKHIPERKQITNVKPIKELLK